MSIILVVFHHAHYTHTAAMTTFDQALMFLRMPLFFFVSGFYIRKMMGYTAARLVARRLAPLLYLYILWSVIKWLLTTVVPALAGEAKDVASIVQIMWEPLATLWFIYALAIFSLLAWFGRNLPRWTMTVMAVAAALLSVVFGPVTDGPFAFKIMRFFIWFWAGYVTGPQMLAWGRERFRWIYLAIVPLWLAASLALIQSDMDLRWWAVLLTITALPVGIMAAIAVARSPAAGVFTLLGKNTLSVYVAHFAPLLILGRFISSPGLLAGIFVVIVAILASVAAKLVADRIGFAWLYELPQRARDMIEARLSRASEWPEQPVATEKA